MDNELKNNWDKALIKTFPAGVPTQATWIYPKEIAAKKPLLRGWLDYGFCEEKAEMTIKITF